MAKMFAKTEFLQDVRQYVIINSTDEWLDLVDQGTSWPLPPNDVAVEPSKLHPTACSSWVDPTTKEYVPGTLVIKDKYQSTPLGQPERMVNVEAAIKTALGYNPELGEYFENLGIKGVSVAPFSATREEIELVRADGLERFRKWKVKESLDLVDAHDLRNEARRRANMSPIPPSREYLKAASALDALKAEDVAEYKQKFALKVGGEPEKQPDAPASKEELVSAILENKELLRMLATAIKGSELASIPGVSAKTAEKMAQVERDMKDIEETKQQRKKYKAAG
jgi:hypothetical protein